MIMSSLMFLFLMFYVFVFIFGGESRCGGYIKNFF